MATKNKTQETDASVAAYLQAIADPARRADCEALAGLLARTTKQPPRMWGTAIVGFGSYHDVYDSGREGDACVVGFASRKAAIALYLQGAQEPGGGWPVALGKSKGDKGCIHVARLADVDTAVLEQLVLRSVAHVKARHGGAGDPPNPSALIQGSLALTASRALRMLAATFPEPACPPTRAATSRAAR